MIEVHIRMVAALDVLDAKLRPQWTNVRLFVNDSEGRSTELWSDESRSFPTLSEMEGEGAKLYGGLPEAATYAEVEAAALEWVRANLLTVAKRADHKLLYKLPAQQGALILNE